MIGASSSGGRSSRRSIARSMRLAGVVVQPDELHGERVVTRDVEQSRTGRRVQPSPGRSIWSVTTRWLMRPEAQLDETAVEAEVVDADRDVGHTQAIALERAGDLPGVIRASSEWRESAMVCTWTVCGPPTVAPR